MVNSGCSLGNGSDRKPAESAVPALDGRPPVQAGIEPSALPAISAPTGVSAPVCSRLFVVFIVIVVLKISSAYLEVHAKAERNKVAINTSVVFTTEEVGVGQAGVVGILIVSIQTKTYSLITFIENTIRTIAINIVGPGNTWTQVNTCNRIGIIPDSARTIAPRSTGDETIILTVFRSIFCLSIITQSRNI